jgi:hypothetical protein
MQIAHQQLSPVADFRAIAIPARLPTGIGKGRVQRNDPYQQTFCGPDVSGQFSAIAIGMARKKWRPSSAAAALYTF